MNKQIKIAIAVGLLALYLLSMISMASALVVSSVSMTPNEIAPGESSEIKIGLRNDLENINVKNVIISLDLSDTTLPFAPFESGSEDSIEEIDDGDTEYAVFKIIALNDASSGIYKIPVQISYVEDNEENITKTKISLISVMVSSEPVLGVDIEDSLFLKGSNEEISIRVINKGLSDVRFVEVELGSSTNYNMLSRRSVYIGDIDSDDFDSVDFKIYFKKSIPDIINVPVSITYKDSANRQYTEDFNIPLGVYTREKAIELGLVEKNNTYLYVGVVVVLVVVYLVYRNIRKRRRLKRANSS